MSRNYDNWERLVAAVLKREQFWQMCHSHSRESSTSSSISVSTEYEFEEKNDRNIIEDEQDEIYERGIRLRIVALPDGTRQIKRARFSPKRFEEEEADAWWSENGDKVYERFNVRVEPAPVINGSLVSGPAKKADGGEIDEAEGWTEEYEPGVYITVGAFRDGNRELKRVHFSKRRFKENEAEAWWSVNREKVVKRYNARWLVVLSTLTQAALISLHARVTLL